MRKNALPLSLVLLAVLAGGYLRVAHLGRDDFGPDELFHVYAAESLRQGEGPRLPSGDLYTRGIEITRLVQLSVEALGPGERNARLPGALLGIIDLCLFAVILWALGGGWTAFWGTLLLALYPEAVAQSRAVRFYTYQLAYGLIALYAGWRALARCGAPERPSRKQIARQWFWVAITLLSFALAARVQIVTLSVTAGWGACVALAAVADLRARGVAAWRTSAPLQLLSLGIVALLLLLVAEPGIIAEIARITQRVPDWVQAEGSGSPVTYARALFSSFPLVVALAPLIFLSIGFSRPRLTVYLFTWFAVPFLAHSFLFPWKGERFILLAVPALFAAAALAATGGAGALRRWISDRLAGYGIEAGARQLYAASSVAVISLFVIATTPALVHGWKVAASQQDNKWRKMAAIIQSRPELQTLPLGTTAPLHALYYLGRSDFVIQPGAQQRRDNRKSEGEPDAVEDFKAGAPILPTPGSIRSRFGAESVLIGTDSGHVDARLDPALLSMLRGQAEDLCRGSCGSGLLYLWHTSDLPSATASPTPIFNAESVTPGGALHATKGDHLSRRTEVPSVARSGLP
jgi:hypothetical protein